WREAKLLRCRQKDHGVGLAVLEVTARDVRVEQVQQGHFLVNEVVRSLFHAAVCHARGPGFSLHPLASSTIHDMGYFSNKSIAKSMNTVKQSGCVAKRKLIY